LDDVPVEDVLRFEAELHDYFARNTKVLDTIRESGKLEDDVKAELEKGVDAFKKEFLTGAGHPLASAGKEVFTPTEVEDVNQEKIVKSRR